MIQAVIFDLNGVFVVSEKLSGRFAAVFHIPQALFLPVLQSIMDTVRRPAAGDAWQYWAPHIQEWGIKLTREEFFSFWFSGEKENASMIDLARTLRANGIRVIILSNNFQERSAFYDQSFPSLRAVTDRIYYSWETGFLKNDPRAYALPLQEFQLSADACVFFDDTDANVALARQAGYQAWRYEGPDRIRSTLAALGLTV